ncbi:sulfotransferase family protein [Hwanghaeella grinnelliae]|uniref:Sulfotransferase family protein n=1 Tax=Hwanghaeella grinnelliae TaxID=2500179 RepID=A0A437QHJ9_9PROT|nr:sulfotransferase [Hwanghaeella grinnelliae]RVU34033.1 sulfotransferase family protein [Hwanghaeella grinnelliae]
MVEYSFLDRILHRIALQFTPIAELSFDIDQKAGDHNVEQDRYTRHIFVSGLARAGTTILMRRIYASGAFCSLTYRNMPFVLAPKIWGKVAARSQGDDSLSERAHGDRILVGVDSPESLDEVFWRIFDGENYITKTCLKPHLPAQDVTEKFAAYVSAILNADSDGRRRYLSKNNNNILRLKAIRQTFPNAITLIPFRDPITHAGSLMRQHANFLKQQKEDPFVQSYMTWLGHHEFGHDHRHFQFDREGQKRLSDLAPDGIEYWLEIWRQTYSWLLEHASDEDYFVCYEDLCSDPETWNRLAVICEIEDTDSSAESFVISNAKDDASADPSLLEEVSALYDRLVEASRSKIERSKA